MMRWIAIGFSLSLLCVFVAGAGAIYVFNEFGRGLPDHNQLANYEPAVATRIYAGDGRLIQEYAVESRIFVPIDEIPQLVIDAFVSAERKADPVIYPPQETRDKFFSVTPKSQSYDRTRTREWTRIKTGL